MFDKLFGKICVDRGWIRQADLEAAIRVREKLIAVGLDRPLGEILVSRGLITAEQAETIIVEQQPGAPNQGEVVLGRLAVQNGLLTESALQRVLEKQREAYQREHTAPTLGFLLVEEGFLTLQQLDALISLQSRLQSRNTQKIEALLSEATLESSVPLAYFVRSRRKDGSWEESEHLMTGPGVRAMIASGELKPSDEVRREDEELSRRITEFPEFSPAVTELRRRETLTRTAQGPQAKHAKRIQRLRRVALVALAVVLLVGTFWLGTLVGSPPEYDDALEGSWRAEDVLGGMRGTDWDTAEDDEADIRTPGPDDAAQMMRDASEAEAALLREIGLVAATDMLGVRRWLPAEEARALRRWRELPEEQREGLQPFETEAHGVVLGVASARGIRRAEPDEVLALSATELERQRRVWLQLRQRHGEARRRQQTAATRVEEVAAELVELATWLEARQWPVHARRVLLEAYQLTPLDQTVRSALQYLLPGENPHEPTQAKLLVTLPRPRMPSPAPLVGELPEPALVPGLFGADDGELPQALPWAELMQPLEVPDVLGPLPLVPDPAAQRRAKGEVQYLGYWLPRETLERMWHDSKRPARFVLRPGQAEVWTELPQFRGEVLSAAGRLYTLVAAYVSDAENQAEVLPPLGQTRLRTVPCRLVVLGPDRQDARAGVVEPAWVEQAVSSNRQSVAVTDVRSPEALVVPLAKGVVRAVMQATYADSAPEWLKEAWSREFASRFALAHHLHKWERVERALDLDRLAALLVHGRITAEFFERAPRNETERALAWALWHALPEERLSPVLQAVSEGDAQALARESDRLQAWLVGQAEPAWPRYVEQFVLEQSERLRSEVTLSPSRLAVLTPAHLALLNDGGATPGRAATTFFSASTGYATHDEGDAQPHVLPWLTPPAAFEHKSMSRYSMRELTALLGLGARLRLVWMQDAESAAAARRDLKSALQEAGLSDWLHILDEELPQDGDDDADVASEEAPVH